MAEVTLKKGADWNKSSSSDIYDVDDFDIIYLQCHSCKVAVNKMGIVLKKDLSNTIKCRKMIIDYKDCPISDDKDHTFLPPNWS